MAEFGHLKRFVGQVVKLYPNVKAVIEFTYENQTERAALWYYYLRVKGNPIPFGKYIGDFIKINDTLVFLCKKLKTEIEDRCGWFIELAWLQESTDLKDFSTNTTMPGLYDCTGYILKVSRRRGILSYYLNGKEERILFLADNFFLGGNRVSANTDLRELYRMEEGNPVDFDAVPCDPLYTYGGCGWYTPASWWYGKPRRVYYNPDIARYDVSLRFPTLSEMALITSSPLSTFLRTRGIVMKIINPEYGIALAAVKENHYESVLFHRSRTTLFKTRLDKADLTKIFQEGDKLRIVAAGAPKKMAVKWVASKVRVYIDPSISHLFPH